MTLVDPFPVATRIVGLSCSLLPRKRCDVT